MSTSSQITATSLQELAKTTDRSQMLQLIREFPTQCAQAVEVTKDLQISQTDLQNIVVLGMGGSAIGADLLRVLLEADGGATPVVVCRDYHPPGFVGPNSLCIAASYSGNTEETLSAARAAILRGAALVSISTGGELSRLTQEAGGQLITIPGGQPPRSALGFMFLPMLGIAERAGLCRSYLADIRDALSALAGAARTYGAFTEENPAIQMAHELRKALPVIYGSGPVTGVVAQRWKCQFNENAKMHAVWNNLPELDHNEICGWRSAPDPMRWIFIRDRKDSRRASQRLEITRSVLAHNRRGHTDVFGSGDSLLARTLTAILLGDFVTAYAAVLNGTDPTDIQEIDVLKAELAAAENAA